MTENCSKVLALLAKCFIVKRRQNPDKLALIQNYTKLDVAFKVTERKSISTKLRPEIIKACSNFERDTLICVRCHTSIFGIITFPSFLEG